MAIDTQFSYIPIPVYAGKVSTDAWYPLMIVDKTDHQTGEAGLAFGDMDVDYSAIDGSDTWSAYAVTGAEWFEVGEGMYCVKIGTGEFSAAGRYVVRVADTTPNGHKTTFCVEVTAATLDTLVRSTTPANALDINATGGVGLGSCETGSITAAAFAADSIVAATLATDSITSDAIAATGTAEIADAVWDEAMAGHVAAGSAGAQLGTDVDAILADTAEMQADLVNGGRLDLLIDAIKAKTDSLNFTGDDVKATLDSETVTLADASLTAAKIGADAITAAKVADDVHNQIADTVWDEAQSGHVTAGSFGIIASEIASILVDTGTDGVLLDLTQVYTEGQTTETVGWALEVSAGANANRILLDGTSRKQYESDGVTVLITRTQSDTELVP